MMKKSDTKIYDDTDVCISNKEMLKKFESGMTLRHKLLVFKAEFMYSFWCYNKRTDIEYAKLILRKFIELDNPFEYEMIEALAMKRYLNNKKKKNEKLYQELGIDTCKGDE